MEKPTKLKILAYLIALVIIIIIIGVIVLNKDTIKCNRQNKYSEIMADEMISIKYKDNLPVSLNNKINVSLSNLDDDKLAYIKSYLKNRKDYYKDAGINVLYEEKKTYISLEINVKKEDLKKYKDNIDSYGYKKMLRVLKEDGYKCN